MESLDRWVFSVLFSALLLLTSACNTVFATGNGQDLVESDTERVHVQISEATNGTVKPAVGVNEMGDPGGTHYSAGNLIPDPGFEPISIRKYWRVVDTGFDKGHWWITVDAGGMTNWDLVTTGYLNGASFRLYRLVDDSGNPLPPTNGYLDLASAHEMRFVGSGEVPNPVAELPAGGFVDNPPNEQRIYLDGPEPAPWDYIYFEKRILEGDLAWSHPRLDDIEQSNYIAETWRPGWGFEESGAVSITREAHRGTVPEAMGFAGESAYTLTSELRETITVHGPYIFFPLNDNLEGNWYSTLEPGIEYRYEAWMRSDNPAGTRVELGFFAVHDEIAGEFTVDDRWRLYSFEFMAPDQRPAYDGWHGGPAIRFAGPGTIQVDNISLAPANPPQVEDSVFSPSPDAVRRLLDSQPETGPKGVLRSMYVALNQASMASLLTPNPDASIVYDWYIGVGAGSIMTIPNFLNYALVTGDSKDNRMTPWLNISSHGSEEEWAMLFEFLAAPVDITDSADMAEKPWAALRAQQRGHGRPYTDDFERIIVEFANETWHNRAVEESWTGWSSSYAVHQGSLEFGLWVKRLTEELRAAGSWYAQAIDSGAIELVMGSNYDQYAEEAIVHAPDVSAIGHALYVGPRWELEENQNSVFDDEGLQATLFGWVGGLEAEVERYALNQRQLAQRGVDYQLYAYEGGPSGYALPGQGEDDRVEIAERYGKSLAMAVATVDTWLGSHGLGFEEMAFHAFTQGTHWSSHTPIREGQRPYPSWLATSMINRYALGTPTSVTMDGEPTLLWRGEQVPLFGVYSYSSGDQLSVVMLNRSLDESFEVSIDVPEGFSAPMEVHALHGDPEATNRQTLEVDEQTWTSEEALVALPPASLTIAVFKGR